MCVELKRKGFGFHHFLPTPAPCLLTYLLEVQQQQQQHMEKNPTVTELHVDSHTSKERTVTLSRRLVSAPLAAGTLAMWTPTVEMQKRTVGSIV